MPPIAIQQPRNAHQVGRRLAVLEVAWREPSVTHVDAVPVAGENVGQEPWHLHDDDLVFRLSPAGVATPEPPAGQYLAGGEIESEQVNTVIQVRRSPGCTVDGSVSNQHAAMYGPRRLQAAIGHHSLILRCGLETPDQRAVGGTQAIHTPVGRPEDNQAAGTRRRRIDSMSGVAEIAADKT